MRVLFLDIFKVFDKVWHDGLLYKLKHNNINGDLLELTKTSLLNSYQRVLLNEKAS